MPATFPRSSRVEKWALPTFFSARNREIHLIETEMDELQSDIESRISGLDPAIEVIAVERPAPDALRLFIDHPGGVDLGLCERVTNRLRDLLSQYTLEVSSPGSERPLTKPEHFRRYLGRRVRVRTREEVAGHKSFTGRLTGADEESVSVDLGDGPVSIPLASVRRSNLLSEGMTP